MGSGPLGKVPRCSELRSMVAVGVLTVSGKGSSLRSLSLSGSTLSSAPG